MARELAIGTMVSLPRLNGSSAFALAEQLLTTADAEKGSGLPIFIERPRVRLKTATMALKNELQPQEEADSGVRVAADREVDNSWRSFSEWLGAMAGMPDGSVADLDKVRTLNGILFGEGLSFIVLSFREEWTQSETRLKAISDGGYEPVIDSLGGAPFLKNVKSTHGHYGEAIGIKAPLKADESPEVREHLTKLTAAMKAYVVKTVAFADPEEPGSDALSEALLVPLTQWKDTPSRPGSSADAPASE